MKFFSCGYHAITWLAVSALCLPAQVVLGHEPIPWAATAVTAADCQITIRDVALLPGGLLAGQVLDANMRPVPDTEVAIHAADSAVATTRTDANGIFAVRGLRGGTHQLITSQGSEICRLWSPGTAPPCATDHLQIVEGQTIARGQGGGRYTEPPMFPRAEAIVTHPLFIGGLLAAAIAIPVSLNNSNERPGS